VKADETRINDVMKTILTMINPFDNDLSSLVHLASGKVASEVVAEDMRTMYDKGTQQADNFLKENVAGKEPNIYAPIRKTNLRTFSSLGKKVTKSTKNGEIVALMNSQALFSKMLLIAKSRDLDMEYVLKYSLRPFPSSLATIDGDLVKTPKAKLLHAVENDVTNATINELPTTSRACVLDGMAMFQSLSPVPETFGALSEMMLAKTVNSAIHTNCKRVDFVIDRYPQVSIKDLERNRRAVANDVHEIRIYSAQQNVPRQWKKFLSSGRNKELIKFLFNSWKSANESLLKGVEVVLAHEGQCHSFTQSNGQLTCTEIQELYSDHEEADTRIVAHAKQASQYYQSILIKSPDTDVLFIALNACLEIPADVFIEMGVGKGRRTLSLTNIRHSVGDSWCRALIGLHALTGKNARMKNYDSIV
jgi:hypothetical protein